MKLTFYPSRISNCLNMTITESILLFLTSPLFSIHIMLPKQSSVPLISLVPVECEKTISSRRVSYARQSSAVGRKSLVGTESGPRRLSSQGVEGDLGRTKWRKTIEPLVYKQSDGYYDSLPIKPGFFFLESLLRAPAATLSSLQLNLPTTLYYSDHLYLLSTGTFHLDAKGRVSVDPEGHFVTLLKKLEASKPAKTENVFDSIAAVLRFKGEQEADMKKHVFDWPLFRQKMLSHDLKRCSMVQEFIRSPGLKPSVVRLTYHAYSKQPTANFAYLITSTVHQSPTSDLLHKVVLDINTPNAVETFKQTGKSLQPYEQAAKSLVDFLQRGYKVRILDICVDFLRSCEGKIYLCGCKGFRIDPATSPLMVEMTDSFSPYYKGAEAKWEAGPKQEHSSLGRFVTCKLCRIQYANHQLPHLVSLQMLIRFHTHARRRGRLPYKTVRLKASGLDLLSQTVRICACCYMLVTAEHVLLAAEMALARGLNIPLKDETEAGAEREPQQFLPKWLQQYRVLIYLEGLETDRTLDYAGQMYLRVRLGRTETLFELERVEDRFEGKFYPVKGLRLVYFFTQEGRLPKSFLREVRIEAELTLSSASSGQVVVSGSSPLLQTFPPTIQPDFALWTTLSLSLFDASGQQRYPLRLSLGLANDHNYDSALLPVDLYKVLDAYMPEESYFTGDPLPRDWVESFGHEQKEDSFGEDEKLEDAYGPLIDRGDLDRMQDITSPYPAPLSNKLVVSRPKPKQLHEIALSSSVRPRSLSPSPFNLSQLSPRTDAQVLEVSHLVDSYLTQKPLLPFQLSPEVGPKTLRRLGKDEGKRPLSGWVTGKTSARSMSPALSPFPLPRC